MTGLKPVANSFRPESLSTVAGSTHAPVDPVMDAIASLTDHMKSISAVLKDVHDISHQHSATLREHANTIHQIHGEGKNTSNFSDKPRGPMWGYGSQQSTRETTPVSRPIYPTVPMAGRIQSTGANPGFPISVPQPYRYAPPMIQPEEPVSQPPVPTITSASPRSPNTTARSIRSFRSRRPSMAEVANVRSTSVSSRSVAAASRGRLTGKPAPVPAPKPAVPRASGRLNIQTISSENRSKSPARVGAELRSKSPAIVVRPVELRSKSPARVGAELRSKSPARTGGQPRASPVSLAEASPVSAKSVAPSIRYELQISYNDHLVAKSQIKPALSEDGPFLYVIQSELDPPLTFIPHPEMPCSFTGLSISILATNTRTRRTNVIFQSHGSHIDNPPVNEMDGYFSHSCWLSGPSASVVGGVRMFFRREEEDSAVTIYAMSLKFWFPESAANGLEQTPGFTREHYKELLKLLGVLNP